MLARFLIPCLLLFAASVRCSAEDWPSFMGPTGDAVWQVKNTIDRFGDDGAKIAWRKKIGPGYAGAAVVQGRVFVMDRTKDDGKGKKVENGIRQAGEIPGGERVLCLDAKSGRELWSYGYDSPYRIAYPTGPRCTPTVDETRVYTLGAMGHLACLNAADGKVLWKKELLKDYQAKPPLWGYSSHPLVVDKLVYVPVGGEGSGLVAFDKLTGKEVWKAISTLDVAYAPVVLFENGDERQLIFWHAEGIDSLDPSTGKKFWTVKFPEKRNPSQTSITTPRIVGNKLLISEYYKGSLLLEIGSNPPSVKENWRSSETDPRNRSSLNPIMATPIIKGEYAYGIANDARGKGILRCIELATGKMVWTKNDWMTPKPLVFATAFAVENQNKYFMFNDIGELMIVRLSPKGFEELDRTKVLEPSGVARGREVVWCMPACADGHMFIRNDNEIISIDLRKK